MEFLDYFFSSIGLEMNTSPKNELVKKCWIDLKLECPSDLNTNIQTRVVEKRVWLQHSLKENCSGSLWFARTLVPDREREVSYVLFAGSCQKAAMAAATFQNIFGLQACDLSVEPPVGPHTHTKKKKHVWALSVDLCIWYKNKLWPDKLIYSTLHARQTLSSSDTRGQHILKICLYTLFRNQIELKTKCKKKKQKC